MIAVAQARPSDRARFIRRTYTHLAGAVGAFALLEYGFIQSGFAGAMAQAIAGSRYAWLMVLGGFALLGWMARTLAANTSPEMQYIGLGLYVFMQALIFAPMIFIAVYFTSPEVLPTAALLTAMMFAGLTAVVFITQKDFSFLGGILTMGGFVALGLIICSVIFGFSLGLFFSFFMVVFASGAILYDTSNIMKHYAVDQHVAASLELFASVALLFWYVLRILMSLSRD
ncbi:Bax inhibitor-1/YccA family protein [Prochlorothrix hollandica]|uniref:Permease n=1 Tax=Prochlorothrix hollandica PCC 9006 = CALU 1027 TaxID=317619 RepID=A0A0M2PWV7_PROHO|nr:Bax inhibitor-1 family protein [Prochlorothrix hollandica]KKI98841.1 permease [Prochlorothrix hollandica PCC 9006 = CALU 1027]